MTIWISSATATYLAPQLSTTASTSSGLESYIFHLADYLVQSTIDLVERERRIERYAMTLRWKAQKYIKNDIVALKPPRKQPISFQIWNRYTRLNLK